MFELKPLPYELEGLASAGMSKETLEYHWGKHQQTYVTNLNNAIVDTPLADLSLMDIMMSAYKEGKTALFNNRYRTQLCYPFCLDQDPLFLDQDDDIDLYFDMLQCVIIEYVCTENPMVVFMS